MDSDRCGSARRDLTDMPLLMARLNSTRIPGSNTTRSRARGGHANDGSRPPFHPHANGAASNPPHARYAKSLNR